MIKKCENQDKVIENNQIINVIKNDQMMKKIHKIKSSYESKKDSLNNQTIKKCENHDKVSENNSEQCIIDSIKLYKEKNNNILNNKINEIKSPFEPILNKKEEIQINQSKTLSVNLKNPMNNDDIIKVNNNNLIQVPSVNKQVKLCEMIGYNSNRVIVRKHDGRYWCAKSKIVLNGAFEASISIVQIDQKKAKNNWYYSVGMIKTIQNETDDNYFKDSICLLSTGKAYHYGSSVIQLFDNIWKTGDNILLKRDKSNNVYFGINIQSSYKLAYISIEGSFTIK